MAIPPKPLNPRVVYADGVSIPIREVWYGTSIDGTHVWVSEDPQSVAWMPGVHTEYDNSNDAEPHSVIVWFDMEGT